MPPPTGTGRAQGLPGSERERHTALAGDLLVHYGHHRGTTGSHLAEAARRLAIGKALGSPHRSHLRLAGRDERAYLWVESSVISLPIDAHRAPMVTAGFLIDVHLHLDQSIRQAALFDVVFVAQRDFVAPLSRVHPHVQWLPLAAPARFLDVPRRRVYEAAFVGNLWPGTPRRALMEAVSHRVTTNDWRRRCDVDEMARVYAGSAVVVNPTIRGDLNMRFFEALACGALVVMPAIGNGQSEIGTAGSDYITYDPTDDVETIARVVERAAMLHPDGGPGRQSIADGHTYDHRIRHVTEVLGSAPERCAPIRSMTAPQRAALLAALAADYGDGALLRAAVQTSPRCLLDRVQPFEALVAKTVWRRSKAQVRHLTPSLAARLRSRFPTGADRQ